MNKRWIACASAIVAGSVTFLIQPPWATAGELLRRGTRARVCYGAYPTGTSAQYSSQRVIATGRVVLTVPPGEPQTVRGKRVKRFVAEPPASQVSAGQVVLRHFGAEIHSDGKHAVTGQLAFVLPSNESREAAAIRGSTARIHVRAFAGPGRMGSVDGQAMLFATRQDVWVPADSPIAISLLPLLPTAASRASREVQLLGVGRGLSLSELVEDSFDRLSHVEIVVEQLKPQR